MLRRNKSDETETAPSLRLAELHAYFTSCPINLYQIRDSEGDMVGYPIEPAASPDLRTLVYAGKLGAIYRIAVVNLLLSVVTLTLYRFWGRARLRRYLWGATSLGGDPFEWSGTGWEMCRSFLIVAAIAIVVLGPYYLLSLTEPVDSPVLVFYQIGIGIAALILAPLGTVLGLRYRLSRSRWRGIRGTIEGSPWPFVWRSVGWNLLLAPTVGLVTPFATVSLRRWLIMHTRIGNIWFACQARGGAVFGAFMVFVMVAGIVLVAAATLVSGALVAAFAAAVVGEQTIGLGTFFGGLGLIAALALAWPCLSAIYHAPMLRHLAETTAASELAVRTSVTAGTLFRHRFGNFLIFVFSLGLGLPVLWHRNARFFARHLEIVGLDRPELIEQAKAAPTGVSEGLLDMLDAGAV